VGAAVVAVVLVVILRDGSSSAGTALASERQRHASAIQLPTGEPIVWGNFVVHAAGDDPVELRSVELLGASAGMRIQRAQVADASRPQSRVLVFGARDFARLPNYAAWRKSLHPLAGYEVRPGARDDELVLYLAPLGRGSFQVGGGVRLRYRVGGDEGGIVLPNQLGVCAPPPCRPPRPKGF
jgi:hypothetical protein